ncbi:hypothetical protein [Streptomyces alanosinicus]|uniref:Uncharacterized protein n=1 Tax=Streptomyces alanosinicus TaxID=68171 RepID=A0A918YS43_9ACTN|nr:hypothetical protein [Streptomyces alanosinicus]GHE11736.1 hypothetical protein GCM10010339_72550 [Streptomyces alanosinicus]
MSPVRRRLLVWILVPVTLLVAGLIGFLVYWGQTPPALGAHSSDVYRVTFSDTGGHSAPQVPTAFIKLPDGSKVGLQIGGPIHGSGPHRALLMIRPLLPSGSYGDGTSFPVAPGDVVREHGLRVKVLKVWAMPDWKKSAVDVQADPS